MAKNKGGRPPKYAKNKMGVEQMEKAIEKYFKSCWGDKMIRIVKEEARGIPIRELKENEYDWVAAKNSDGKVIKEIIRPYTITGLALSIGLLRDNLLNYEGKKEFQVIVKKAKERVQNFIEEKLLTEPKVAGPIFWLKANAKWQDRVIITGEDGTPIEINVVNFSGTSKKNGK